MSNAQVAMRRLTVPEALKLDDISLYVFNTVKPGGNINLTVKGDDGVMQTVVVPKTFIPVDMTLFIGRENLLNNQIFRRLVLRGDLVIVETKEAEKAIAKHPRAVAEQSRILASNTDYSDQAANLPETISMIVAGDDKALAGKERSKAEIKPFAAGIVGRAMAADCDVADLMADIEANISELSIDDLEYIATNVEDQSLKQFIIDQIG